MHANILIIEDDNSINNMIAESVKKEGYRCGQAFSGTEGLLLMERESYDLVVLDLMLPGMNGEAFLEKIRPEHSIPVIVVSAKDELDSKIDLLTMGADDYLTKPFEIRELIARIAVQLRKKQPQYAQDKLTFKDLELDREKNTCQLCGEELKVTRQELRILELLMGRPDKVFSKQEIYEYAWDEFYIGEDKTINVHMSNIRHKIKEITDQEYIETVWGIGFKMAKQ